MQKLRFASWATFLLIISMAAISACQKDPELKDVNQSTTSLSVDSTSLNAETNLPGNFLAVSGKLTLRLKDSTYIFDASKDSIAFVKVQTDDSNQYFGITAINKEHTISFGISAAGLVKNNMSTAIAGGQFLLNQEENKPGIQYFLSRYSGEKEPGNITITQFNQGNVLAKGVFTTFLAKDDKPNSTFYKVEGSFDLQLK